MFQLGIEKLLKNKKALSELRSKRVGLVAHPASVDKKLNHSIDLLHEALGTSLTCAFGPQHGLRGEKQDNMIESDDFKDPNYNIPIFSLYGEVRRPTKEMLEHFDVLLFDLQDVGCRIYTFITTLFYCLEDCAKTNKSLWVLDRPNPAGRPVEGNIIDPNYFSFIGAAEIPMRHGMTLAEAGQWYIDYKNLDVDYKVIKMSDYDPEEKQDWGWPSKHLSWVNPSPNLPTLSGVRMYAGTVLFEGLNLSEGRGTTRPLELLGDPDLNGEALAKRTLKILPEEDQQYFLLRPCFFEPTFQKHHGKLCSGVQIHIDIKSYKHKKFRPYRLACALMKAAFEQLDSQRMWKQPPYEYELEKLPIDILSGNDFLRKWVEDKSAKYKDLDEYLLKDEKAWAKSSKPYLLY